MEFRARLRSIPKPGSIGADGGLVDYAGMICLVGPCFIPDPRARPHTATRAARLRLINEAGWRLTPAKDWPGMAPQAGLICVRRERI